jgi:2'-5' RNA ligase
MLSGFFFCPGDQMPFELQQSGPGWIVVNSETGKPQSRRPLPRARAAAQLRALYAKVPDARTKEAGHTGVMLAFFVPPAALPVMTALQEGLPNPEPTEDLHLTLAYLGDTTSLYYQRADLERMLNSIDWVAFGLPLAGTVGGIGRFHHDEGNGTNAVYASFDAPGLPSFRQRLIDMLKMNGIMPAENHGFTPHITLAYVPVDQDVPTLPPDEMSDLVFGALTLAWGDERIEYGPGARMKAAQSNARPMTRRRAAREAATTQKALAVFKDASGRYRWVTRTTTAYRDRDGEIISTKAIADDVAWSDAHRQYGPLRWWHTGKPNPRYKEWGPDAWGPGLDIGDCDLRAVSGNCLLESGTFRDERIGAAIAEKADQYGVSPGFFHSALEPDADGVFSSIKTFERSLVPLWRGTPANLFTRLMVQEVHPMDATKRKAWEEAGVPSELIERYVQDNEATEKSAAANGITFKEADAPPADAPTETTPHAEGTPEQVFFGDLTLDQAQAWIQQQLQPLVQSQATLATATATKSAGEEATQVALKSTQDALTTLQATLKADREAVDAKLTTALKQIAELQGDVPSAVKRASQDGATIATKEQIETFKGPAADPMNEFLGFVTGPGGAG